MDKKLTLVLVITVIVLLVFVFWPKKKSFMEKNEPYHIVVAKYNEDTSWLPHKDPYVKIYDKGPGGTMKNIGREAHTYLTYIVENYDSLPEVIFFTQGSPDHMGEQPIEYFIKLEGKCSQNHITTDIKTGLDENLHRPDYGGQKLHPESLDFKEWMKENIGIELNNELTFYKGATFSVKKESILSRPLEFYEKMLSLIPDHSSPEIAHYFERAWWYIFN